MKTKILIGGFNINTLLDDHIKDNKTKVLYLFPSFCITSVVNKSNIKSIQLEMFFICWNYYINIYYV